MNDYTELGRRMTEGSVVKAVMGDYVVYKREWLYDHIEQEYALIRSIKESKPIQDGITKLRDYLAEHGRK